MDRKSYPEKRYHPNIQAEAAALSRHKEADARFVRLLAEAIWRGDNLPKGHPRPVRPVILRGD